MQKYAKNILSGLMGLIIGAGAVALTDHSTQPLKLSEHTPAKTARLSDDQVVTNIETALKIKEVGRFDGEENIVVYGQIDQQAGKYFIFNKATKTFSDGGKFYYLNHKKVESLSSLEISTLRDTLLPKLAEEYGFVLGGNGNKIAYILADTTCPFSEKYFTNFGAAKLMDSGYKVVVIPMSRKVEQDELVGLSVFNCTLTSKQKKAAFIAAINNKKPLIFPVKQSTEKCAYWGNLKALYSIFEDFKLDGFPAIIKSDSNDIEYSI